MFLFTSYELYINSNVVKTIRRTKMNKKIVIGTCLMALAATSMFAAKKGKQGKVLNIYVWNDEFTSRFNDYYASRLPKDVKVNFIQTPNQKNAYQYKLD